VINWGSVADWVSGVGSLSAVVTALGRAAGSVGLQGQVSHCTSSVPENALIESVEMVNGRPDPGVGSFMHMC
jgi:hypothetical protein